MRNFSERVFHNYKWFEQACKIVLQRVPDGSTEHGSVQSNLSRFAFFRSGDYETAATELQSVIDDAISRSDPKTEMLALVHLGMIAFDSHRYREAVEMMQGALEISRDLGDIHVELQMLMNLRNAYCRLKDRQERLYLQKYRELAERVGGRHHKFFAYRSISGIAYERADLESAYEYQTKAMAIREPMPYEWFVVASIELERGNLDAHARCMQNACDLFGRDGALATDIRLLATASYHTGDERWLRFAERHVELAFGAAGNSEEQRMYVAAARAWLLIAQGDRAAAQDFRDEAKFDIKTHGALVARLKGDTETAIRYLHEAIDDLHSREFRNREYWASYWLAETLLSRGEPGDEEMARAIAGEVIENTERVGMVFLREKAEELCRRIPDVGAANPDGLTEREVDVLRLVAEGLTNKVIGEKLYISDKTVSTHMKHIFAKIGVTNRAEATVYAIKHDLIRI